MNNKKSNKLADVRGIVNGGEGKNYPFDDCMAFIMERLGEDPQLDYWTFTWITGDGLTQVYDKRTRSTSCDYCVSGYLAGKEHIERVFNAVGYDYIYVSAEQINADKKQYIQKVKDYIDKGLPVLVKSVIGTTPSALDICVHSLFAGYEEDGGILLDIRDYDNICEFDIKDFINQDWIFIGEKNRNIPYDDIILNAVRKMRHWLTLPETNGKCYGAAAFRAWADDVERGRFDDEPDLWANYGVYFCNMATNSWANNISDAPHASLLYKFAQINPQFAAVRDKIAEQYFRIGNGDGAGGIWKELEELGGGFNVSHAALRDKETKAHIAEKLREAADYTDEVVWILERNL